MLNYNSIFNLSNNIKYNTQNILYKNNNTKSNDSIVSCNNQDDNLISDRNMIYNNIYKSSNNTILQVIENKNIYLFKYLLKYNNNLLENIDGVIPLFTLIEQNSLYFLNAIINDIDFNNINYNITTLDGNNIFIKCAKVNNLIIFKKIINTLNDNNSNSGNSVETNENLRLWLNSTCNIGNSVLYYFIIKNNIHAVNFILTFNNINLQQYNQDVPLIHTAILLGNMEIILKLIDYDNNILYMKNKINNLSTLQLIIQQDNLFLLRLYMKKLRIQLEDLYDINNNKLLIYPLSNNNTLMFLDLIQLYAIIKIQRYYKKKIEESKYN